MKTSRFTETQIVGILNQAEAGMKVKDLCRKYGISDATYRNEVLNLYLFRSLDEVREITSRWIDEYNDLRPHDALGGLPPSVYSARKAENSTLELST